MNKKIESWEPPQENDIVARYVIGKDEFKATNPCEEQIVYKLTQEIVSVIQKDINFIHYKESITTGKKYDGFYDYIPACDPLCNTVYEARFSKYREALKRIKYLEDESLDLRKTISHMSKF